MRYTGAARRFLALSTPTIYEYGKPLAHIRTGNEGRLDFFGGEFQPNLYRPVENRNFESLD
ncbi:hypothetical protein PGQ11_009279 [Apiospora arundinis]|uniref:Uncharacterized protein n=1 Tax=Apiospora arundinis TaxID=335852 RepID=A0ABR2IHP8_9PEZI